MFYQNGLFGREVFIVYIVGSAAYADGSSLDNGSITKNIDSFLNFSHNVKEEKILERIEYLANVNKQIWLIFAPTLLFIGLIGNTLSILVLRR